MILLNSFYKRDCLWSNDLFTIYMFISTNQLGKICWPGSSVKVLSRRTILRGFVSPDSNLEIHI